MGIREQKREETLRRITRGAMALFTRQGYDATTIEAIAAAAGISRRTFFHYFKSKDDILLSQQAGMGEQLIAALQSEPAAASPFLTVTSAMRRIAAAYALEELVTLDRMMMGIEAVQQRKEASYVRDEKLVLAALRQRWPDADDMNLRTTAMLAIALSRLSLTAWREDGGSGPLLHYLDAALAALGQDLAAAQTPARQNPERA